MAFGLAFDLQAQSLFIGYRPEITSARVPKRSQTIGRLPKQLTQQWPVFWPSMSNSRWKDGVPNVVPKLLKQVYQNGLKRQLASLSSLHNHDLRPDNWPWMLNSRSKHGYWLFSRNCVSTHTKKEGGWPLSKLYWEAIAATVLHNHAIAWAGCGLS